MILLFCKFLMWLCGKLNRIEYISENRGKVLAEVYLVRYNLIKNRYFSLYIHRFLKDDLDDLHDHPWNFATFMVQGSYTEVFYNGKAKNSFDPEFTSIVNYRSVKNLRFVTRKGDDFHKVVLDKQYSLETMNDAPLTIFLAFTKYKNWGFITPNGWVHSRDYIYSEKKVNV